MLNAQTHPNSKVVQNVSSALNSLLADMIALVRRPSINSNSVAQADRAALTRRLRMAQVAQRRSSPPKRKSGSQSLMLGSSTSAFGQTRLLPTA
jgi:hypothetical protein